MDPTQEQIEKAVAQLLAEGKWPIYDTYDDAGLEQHEYVQFVQEVLAEIKREAQGEQSPD
jgi:ribose 5-phosphate isomerase RpiB